MQRLEQLFVKIAQLEKQVETIQRNIHEADDAIIQSVAATNQVEEEITDTKLRISKKVEQLNFANAYDKKQEVATAYGEERERVAQVNFLENQGKLQRERLENLQKKEADLKARIQSDRDAFILEAEQFSAKYDLCSDGRKEREKKATVDLQQLTAQHCRLEQELSECREKQSRISDLREDLNKSKLISQSVNSQLMALSEELQKVEGLNVELESEKQRVSLIPKTDPEFIRYQEELESSRAYGQALEQQWTELQQQHSELQRRARNMN